MKAIHIATDYSPIPGPRYEHEGPHSGEAFRGRLLLPRFRAAREAGVRLSINLDGVRFGYPTSFLEEAFGGLARQEGIEQVLETLDFVSTDEPTLIEEVKGYIRDANRTSPERAERARTRASAR